jgi:Dolichyl-phosphate-mannose-protein mannosyltransferase
MRIPALSPLFNRLFSLRSSPSDSTLALAHVNLKYWPVLTVLAWTLFAALMNTGQFGDNIEQFNWAHSFEWGYYKHPPLPTWLLGLFTLAAGQSPYATYLLGFICLALTGILTHDIARRLLGLPVANFAIVLWSLQIPFNWRAQVYNHNTPSGACSTRCRVSSGAGG